MLAGRVVLAGGVDGEVELGAVEVLGVPSVGSAVGRAVSVGIVVGTVGVLDESGALDIVSLEDDAGFGVPVVHALMSVAAAPAATIAAAPLVRRRLTRFGRSGRNSAPEGLGLVVTVVPE